MVMEFFEIFFSQQIKNNYYYNKTKAKTTASCF